MVVIFDFDGVVNKSDYFSVSYEKDFGVSQEEISIFFQKDFNDCAIGKADIKEILPPYLKQWKWQESVDSFLAYWFAHDIKLDKELMEYIEKIKTNCDAVILASQQEINRKTHIWENFGLNNLFHNFYCTCDLGYLKSDKAFYLKIIEALKKEELIKSPDDIIFFDDSKTFVEAARQAGIETYLVKQNEDIFNKLENTKQQ